MCQLWQEGHAASECRQQKLDKRQRLFFNCGKPSHESRQYPDKGKAPVKALEDAPRRVPIVFAVTNGFTPVRGRRAHPPQLGDFIKTHVLSPQPCKAGSRFRPLTLEDWHEIAAETALCAKGR